MKENEVVSALTAQLEALKELSKHADSKEKVIEAALIMMHNSAAADRRRYEDAISKVQEALDLFVKEHPTTVEKHRVKNAPVQKDVLPDVSSADVQSVEAFAFTEDTLQLEPVHTDAPVIPASGPIIFREPGEVQKFTVKGKLDLKTVKEDPIYVVESDLTDDEAVQVANAILTFTDFPSWCNGDVDSISIHLKALAPRKEGELPFVLWKKQIYEVDAFDENGDCIGTSKQFYLNKLDEEIVAYLRKQSSFGKYDIKTGKVVDCYLAC